MIKKMANSGELNSIGLHGIHRLSGSTGIDRVTMISGVIHERSYLPPVSSSTILRNLTVSAPTVADHHPLITTSTGINTFP
ncbi:MAG: hypothetical protein KAT81_01395 [Syntrophobacterales bacterium]|nr:hypothetical protein [Syntrophobacterales bacterium]